MFGLNELLSIVILIITISLIVSEYKNKNGKEIIFNSFSTILILGVSIHNLYNLGFTSESIIITIAYSLNIIGAIIFTILFIIHYFKNRKNMDENSNNNQQ